MKKFLDMFLILFFIMCLGIIIGTFCFIVKCCSGNTELMYKGVLEKTKIQIEKNLGNATMASYMEVYVDDQIVYNEKCYVRDTIENVIWQKEKGILQIILQGTKYEIDKDTITITIKGSKDQKK